MNPAPLMICSSSAGRCSLGARLIVRARHPLPTQTREPNQGGKNENLSLDQRARTFGKRDSSGARTLGALAEMQLTAATENKTNGNRTSKAREPR